MRQLSRPGVELQCQIETERKPDQRFSVHLDLCVNGRPTWRWVLMRRFLDVVAPFDAGCARDKAGKPIFATSVHSYIMDLR